MAHALLSPSSAHRWMSCPGSVSLSRLFPDESSSYAEEGTLAHAWAAHLLDPQNQPQPAEALGSDNMTFVQDYVLFVERETASGVRRIEYPVSVSEVTGEANAKGTIDCAALVNGTLKIIDLKFGKGVKVDAEHNTQLMIYAAGALPLFDVIDEVKDIELTIFQPRINNICSWKLTPAELDEFVNKARARASIAINYLRADPLPLAALEPSADACRFCKAKAACPALQQKAAEACDFRPVLDRGQDIPIVPEEALSSEQLSLNLQLADLLEPWIAAVREAAYDQMMQGVQVEGFKLVLGRPGNRQWTSNAEAEAMLKSFKLKEDERYTYKVITPTALEKLLKAGRIGERQWKRAETIITRSEPAPTVVPAADKRQAWSPVAASSDFTPISN